MKVRNEILKLAVKWDRREPDSLPCTHEWTEPHPGLMWKLLDWPDEGPVVVEAVASPGLDFKYHMHPDHDELLIVVEGEAHVEVIKKKHILRAGETLIIPRGVLHRGVYPDGCKLLLIFK
jgi:mannose-6-phosphate isomerase-like protein (cupin superfamily)